MTVYSSAVDHDEIEQLASEGAGYDSTATRVMQGEIDGDGQEDNPLEKHALKVTFPRRWTMSGSISNPDNPLTPRTCALNFIRR